MQAGLSPEEARRAARHELDGVEQVKERVRSVRAGAVIENLFQDIRYAVRIMEREKGFTAITVLTLALGIGINTAVFSVLNAVVLAPLPYDAPGALTIIWSAFEKMGAARAPGAGVELREMQRATRTYRDMAAIWVGTGTPHGRARAGADQARLCDLELLRRARRASGVVGKVVRLQGGAVTILGVMPAGFRLYFPPDSNVAADVPAYMPFPYDIASTPRDLYFLRFLGRLKPGVTVQQGQEDLNSIAQQLRGRYPEYGTENLKLQATQLQRDAVREIRPGLLALMIGAGFVLLMGCVNVANLSLARANARRKEIAVRGASRGRVIRQLLAESLVLAAISGVAGLAIGWEGVRVLSTLRPDSLARIDGVGINPVVLGFVAAISHGAAILFGTIPALEATKINLMEALREAGRGAGIAGRKHIRMALIVGEVTLGFVLLTGAGLMILSLLHVQTTSPGFDSSHVLAFEIDLPGRYRGDPGRVNFIQQWEARLAALPGVQSVGAVSHLPLDDYPNWYSPYAPEGATEAQSKNLLADYRAMWGRSPTCRSWPQAQEQTHTGQARDRARDLPHTNKPPPFPS